MITFSTASPEVAAEGRIVVGFDGSEDAARALRWAADECRARGTGMHVVACWTFPAWVEPFPYQAPFTGEEFEQRTRASVTDAVAELGDADALDVTAQVLEGPAAMRFLEFADTAAMIVVGSRGRGGFTGLLLGSVGRHLTEHARCPVVVVH